MSGFKGFTVLRNLDHLLVKNKSLSELLCSAATTRSFVIQVLTINFHLFDLEQSVLFAFSHLSRQTQVLQIHQQKKLV